MANPNIVNVATIKGKTVKIAAQKVASVAEGTQLITNAASSGKVFKVNSIIVANIQDGSWKQITKSTKLDTSALVWSQDGKTIGYNRNIQDEITGKSFAQVFALQLNQNLLP